MSLTPERFLWAAELLNIKSSDNILEIGCGAGLLAERIADRLTTGKFLAIDKSVSMLSKARQRNKKHIDRGTSKFVAEEFSKSSLPTSYFDCIVAFNVNFFWKDPAKEFQFIKRTLKKNGKLFVFYQAPYEIDISAADPIKRKLTENEFEIVDIQLKKLFPTSAFCIISKPNQVRL